MGRAVAQWRIPERVTHRNSEIENGSITGVNVPTRFQFYEIVRVIGQSPRVRENLIHKVGIVVGMGDPDALGRREYGVHFNDLRETFALSEDLLVSCGRVGSRKDVIGIGFQEQLKEMQEREESDC